MTSAYSLGVSEHLKQCWHSELGLHWIKFQSQCWLIQFQHKWWRIHALLLPENFHLEIQRKSKHSNWRIRKKFKAVHDINTYHLSYFPESTSRKTQVRIFDLWQKPLSSWQESRVSNHYKKNKKKTNTITN